MHARLRRALDSRGARLFESVVTKPVAESPELESILRAVSDAYYRDELGGIDALFNSADAILATRAVSDRQRVDAHLWQAAVALTRGDPERASEALDWALAIEGPVRIDTKTYRPAFARFVREFLAQRGELHRVELVVFPPDAVLQRESRRLSTRQYFGSAGQHRLSIRAVDMKPIDIQLELPTASPDNAGRRVSPWGPASRGSFVSTSGVSRAPHAPRKACARPSLRRAESASRAAASTADAST